MSPSSLETRTDNIRGFRRNNLWGIAGRAGDMLEDMLERYLEGMQEGMLEGMLEGLLEGTLEGLLEDMLVAADNGSYG